MADPYAPDRTAVVTSGLPAGAASEATLAAINTKDFATQATLQALLAAVQGLQASNTRETTLGAVLAAVDGVEGLLAGTRLVQVTNPQTTIDVTDRVARQLGSVSVSNFPAAADNSSLAKETTLGAILASLDDASQDTVLGVLKAVYVAVTQRTRPTDAQTVTGTVNVGNFPPDPSIYPLPAAQVADLKTVAVSNFPATPPSDITDRAARLLGRVSVDNAFATETSLVSRASEVTVTGIRDRLPAAGTASEATLGLVLVAVDTLEALTTDVRNELRRRRTHRTDSGSASIAVGGFATVYSVTPAMAVVVTGYNADLNATGTVNYRLRFITGTDAAPTIITQEQVSTSQNSWTNVQLSVPAGTRLAVQVFHGEVTAQEFRASISYYEEP